MVVNGNSQHLFGLVLADHIFIKEFFDLGRPAYVQLKIIVAAMRTILVFSSQLLCNDLLGMLHAVLTDMTILAGNQDLNLIAAAATERTM
jgi:hypothetical protein